MRQDARPIAAVLAAAVLTGLIAGCQQEQQAKPDYSRPLPPGAWALRKLLSPEDWPDLQRPFEARDDGLVDALDRSLRWYDAPSAERFFPLYDIGYTRAKTSVFAIKTIAQEADSPSEFEQRIQREFDCYTSVGYDDRGTVLFTGYYTPIFEGSKEPTQRFNYPLYKKPEDLDIDPLTGEVRGRELSGGGHEPFPSRQELESSDELAGLELVYVESRLDQYIIHVNGSAKIELADGGTMYVGYAGNNGHEYTGLGQTLVEQGIMPEEELSLPAIRRYFRDKPDQLEHYIRMNDRFVFFTEYDGSRWPAGSLGVKVTPRRTLATDNDVFPRGAVTVVNADIPALSGGQQSFEQIMADQDTGGAIRAAGRADIYMGIGEEASTLAGRQFSEGRLYYFFLKHGRILDWAQRMRESREGEQQEPAGPPRPSDQIARGRR